ncbi:MAG: undecaprenyl-diphosphate phosphatase, partial [Coriobacteriales bacterium]|nr:undecaprenyl-diphosphate phosphatase [Coriobacteriales bacterium]
MPDRAESLFVYTISPMDIIELLKALLIGIVEGVTEWLPISSTGHMILFDEFVKLDVSPKFLEMFLVVIQLGAIMAVLLLYFHRLNPFSPRKDRAERRVTLRVWGRVLIGCIPAAIVGFLLDDWMEAHFFNAVVVACALVLYGVAFILVERLKGGTSVEKAGDFADSTIIGKHSPSATKSAAGAEGSADGGGQPLTDAVAALSIPKVLGIGAFQCLAIVPGTSRSGSTILGGLILGVSRTVAAEFSFFLAIPVMLGWSLLKVVKAFLLDGLSLTATEGGVLVVGIVS